MQMDVSELAAAAKENQALMSELWQTVERLIAWWASRYVAAGARQGSRLFDYDDLIQSGYLALVDAVQTFDSEVGMAFTAFLGFHIRRHFAECSGHRGTKHRPEIYADSLDALIGDDGNISRLDLLADKEAYLIYDDILERIGQQQACAAILAELDILPEQQRQAIILHIYEGKTLKAAAALMGISPERVRQCEAGGLRKLRRLPRVRASYYDFYHVSLARYKTTLTSAVEWEVLRREREGYYRGEKS